MWIRREGGGENDRSIDPTRLDPDARFSMAYKCKQVTPEVVDLLSKPLNVYLYVGPHVEPEKPEVRPYVTNLSEVLTRIGRCTYFAREDRWFTSCAKGPQTTAHKQIIKILYKLQPTIQYIHSDRRAASSTSVSPIYF